MPFGDQRLNFSISINILHDLIESRGANGVAMNPWSYQQQIILSIGVDNIARHLRSWVPDLTFEFNLSHWACTICVEIVNGSLSGAQSISGDSQVLHDPAGYDAQRGSWIHLNAAHFRRSNIPCEVQGPIMFTTNLHVIWSEGYTGSC